MEEAQPKAELGLKEVLEMKDFLVHTLNRAADAMSDGKISTGEALTIAMAEIPDAMKALAGAGQIPAELKDVSDEEKNQLAAAGLELMAACAKLFSPALAAEISAGA